MPRQKKVLPVLDSPAIAVILFPGTPPWMLPETSPLKMYAPVSINALVSPAATPSATIAAY